MTPPLSQTNILGRSKLYGKLWTQNHFVEIIGNADGKTIRKYVQKQLIEFDSKEEPAR